MTAPDETVSLYHGKIVIDYYDAKHLYIVREDGHIPLSVTAATGVLDKPALRFWAVGLTRDYLLNLVQNKKVITEQIILDASKLHQQFTKKAATVGSMVHDWAEAHVKGEEPTMPVDKKVLNGITAFLKWIDEHKIKFLAAEKIVYSKKYDYVGKMDCAFTMESEKHKIFHVGDYKTSSGFYPEYRFQTSAYQEADQEESGIKYGSKWLMRFDKETGEFESREFFEHKEDLAAFLGALAAKRRLKELQEVERNGK